MPLRMSRRQQWSRQQPQWYAIDVPSTTTGGCSTAVLFRTKYMPVPFCAQVVIGGGLASIKVQRLLAQSPGFASDFSVTVVQPHDFYECPITQPSCFLKPEQHGQQPCVLPLEQVHVEGVKYVLGVAIGVTHSKVELEGGESLPCDAIIVCTGCYYPFLSPARTGESLEARTAFVRSFGRKVGAANAIVIGGGGPVACEMAGVIRALNAVAKIQLVCRGAKPMDEWGGRASTQALRSRLHSLRVQVISNESAVGEASLEPTTVKLVNAGKMLETDIYLPMFAEYNTAFVAHSVPDSVDRTTGRIKVDDYCRSIKQRNLWAIGCANNARSNISVIECQCQAAVPSIVAHVTGAMSMPLGASAVSSESVQQPKTYSQRFAKLPAPAKTISHVMMPVNEFAVWDISGWSAPYRYCAICCGCGNPICPCCACLGLPGCDPSGRCSGASLGYIFLRRFSTLTHPTAMHAKMYEPSPPDMWRGVTTEDDAIPGIYP
jgi:NADH dehydrogenase FAD-containing subunit